MLRRGPITRSLEALTLDELDLPPSELPHLYNLRRLRTLRLDHCFYVDVGLHAAIPTRINLSLPTALLPALTLLSHRWSVGYGIVEIDERQGPSYKWMQQRLAQ